MAQREYKKGYILLNDKDTLHGFISYYINSTWEVYFKGSPDEKAIRYGSNDCIGFGIPEDSITYAAALTPFCSFSFKHDEKLYKQIKYEWRFLKPLVIGARMSLYKLTGEDLYYLYIDHKYEQLCYNVIPSDEVNEQMGVVFPLNDEEGDCYVYDYRNVLKKYIPEGDTLRPYVEQMPFTEEAMRRIITQLNAGNVRSFTKELSNGRRITPFIGVNSVMAGIGLTGAGVIPQIPARSKILPCFTMGLRWREKDRAGPYSGNIAVSYTMLNSKFAGAMDTVTDILYTYRLDLLSAHIAFDACIADFNAESRLSAGIFIGYRWCKFTSGPLQAKIPSNSNVTLDKQTNYSTGMAFGLHASCLFKRWELAATIQLAREDFEDFGIWYPYYSLNFHQTGLVFFYHF